MHSLTALVLAFVIYQCEATTLSGMYIVIGKGDANINASLIDRLIIRVNDGMMDGIRYLKEGEEANVHKRKELPYINVECLMPLLHV